LTDFGFREKKQVIETAIANFAVAVFFCQRKKQSLHLKILKRSLTAAKTQFFEHNYLQILSHSKAMRVKIRVG
jgi:hypothetical protein